MQNSDFRTRLTSVCGSQTSSVVLSTHNSLLSTRIKRQSGFQPSPVVLCMQTATLALELLVSIVPCPHLRFLHANQRLLDQNNKSLCMGTRPHLSLCACITAPFGTELQVSMGSSSHLWFCALKTATLELKLHVSMGPRPHL